MKQMKKPLIIIAAVMALAVAAMAQIPSSPPGVGAGNFPTPATDMPPTNAVAAQAAGQAVLDSVPVLGSLLKSIPATTFDQASFEVMLGLRNAGAQLNNAIDGHYNVRTNFYLSAGITLGGGNTLNSAGVGAGWRHAWPLWEVYGGLAGDRNFSFNAWEGGPLAGCAWKPSSGMAVYAEWQALIKDVRAAPAQVFKLGVCLPL